MLTTRCNTDGRETHSPNFPAAGGTSDLREMAFGKQWPNSSLSCGGSGVSRRQNAYTHLTRGGAVRNPIVLWDHGLFWPNFLFLQFWQMWTRISQAPNLPPFDPTNQKTIFKRPWGKDNMNEMVLASGDEKKWSCNFV